MRKDVLIEGELLPTGLTLVEVGALWSDDDRIPVTWLSDFDKVVGWASDFKREVDGDKATVSMDFEMFPQFTIPLEYCAVSIHMGPYELSKENKLQFVVNRARIREITLFWKEPIGFVSPYI